MKKIFVLLLTISGLVSNAQVATKLQISGAQPNTSEAPAHNQFGIIADFKTRSILGVPGTGGYSTNLTISPWADNSGNKNHQLNFNDGGIFYRNANPLDAQWGVWRTLIMTDVNGNVGIGTDAPASKLEVNGAILAGSGNSSQGQNILSGRYAPGSFVNWGSLYSSVSAFMGFGVKARVGAPGGFVSSTSIASSKSAIMTDSEGFHVLSYETSQSIAEGTAVSMNEGFTVKANGNVGIGTINPAAKLEVKGNIYNSPGSGGKLVLFDDNNVRNNRIELYADTNGANISSTYTTGGTGAINFNTAGGVNRMKIADNGNVGIGKSNPSAKLDVVGDSNLIDPSSRIIGYNDRNSYYFGSYPVVDSAGLDIHWFGGIKFGTSYGDAMQILQNGNIGIGTTNPQYKFDVRGGSYSYEHTIQSYSPTLILKRDTNTGGFTEGIQTRLLDGTDNWFFGNLGTEEWRVSKGNYNNPKLVVRDNGNVGIGTATPAAKLDVVGKSSFSDNMAVQGKIEAKEIKVTTTPTADFVFANDYSLPKLEEVEKHIKDKKHLPEIASAKEMEKEGVNVGEFQIKLLQKIEELTLYAIEQDKRIKELESIIKAKK